MKALHVFTAAIKFLREFLLYKELPNRGHRNELFDNEIMWVITVPAIWDNAAKQFMRDAAIKVNFNHRNYLSLCLLDTFWLEV